MLGSKIEVLKIMNSSQRPYNEPLTVRVEIKCNKFNQTINLQRRNVLCCLVISIIFQQQTKRIAKKKLQEIIPNIIIPENQADKH